MEKAKEAPPRRKEWAWGGGVYNMSRVRVCAAHMGRFLGPKFSKQGSLFRQILHKQGWVIQKLAKDSKKWVVFRQNSS